METGNETFPLDCFLHRTQQTALPYTQHYASRSGHAHICRLLLAAGAEVNAQTPGGVAPLHRAAYCGRTEVVQLVLQHGADVIVMDSDGRTPLHKVSFTKMSECLRA